jgi:hypothetical protein
MTFTYVCRIPLRIRQLAPRIMRSGLSLVRSMPLAAGAEISMLLSPAAALHSDLVLHFLLKLAASSSQLAVLVFQQLHILMRGCNRFFRVGLCQRQASDLLPVLLNREAQSVALVADTCELAFESKFDSSQGVV